MRTSLDLLSKYLLIMELYFDAMLCFNFDNEYSDAGHIKCSCEPQVHHPCLKAMCFPACVIWSAHLVTC